MKEKYKIALVGIAFGILLLLPLLGPRAGEASGAIAPAVPGGTIGGSGSATTFYPANSAVAGGGISMSRNCSDIDRLNRDVMLRVNVSRMVDGTGWDTSLWGTTVHRCQLNVTYPNGTSVLVTKDGAATLFTFIWETNVTMPVGAVQFRVVVWNFTHAYTDGFDFTNVTSVYLFNVLPVGSVALGAENVYRNETLSMFFSVFDPETPFPSLTWSVRLFHVASNKTQRTWGKADTLNQSFTFNTTNPSNMPLGQYGFGFYVRDANGGTFQETVSTFELRNNPPVVNAASFNFTASFKRVVDKMRFNVNVTDSDNNKTTSTVAVILEHQADENFPERLNHTAYLTYNQATGNFTGNVSVPAAFPTGLANIIIEARDSDTPSAVGRYSPPGNNQTNIVNNKPALHGVKVNGKSLAAGLHFTMNEILTFTVNASDVEGGIDFVRVTLTQKADRNDPGAVNYYFYGNDSSTFTVRVAASVLSPGSWYVYITIIDIDSDVLNAESSGTLEIDPDLRDLTGNIIGGILLAILGFVIGGLVIWRYANARISAVRRDMIIKAKSKDVPESKKAKPGEKGSTGKYVEPPSKPEPEPRPAEKPFVGAQAPSARGKPAPDKKPDAAKPKAK